MKKEVKILEICFMGSGSVVGGIAEKLGYNSLVDYNDYCWLILVNPEALDMAEDQCKRFGIEEFMVCDRKSMKVGKPK